MLKPVAYLDTDEVIEVSEVAIFVGRNFVVSVRHGESTVLRRVRSELERGEVDAAGMGPMCVLYQAADHVVDDYERAIALIDDDVADIDGQVWRPD